MTTAPADAAQDPAWIPCEHCGDLLCVIHEVHACDCPCPSLEFWDSELGLLPTEQGGDLSVADIERLKAEHGYAEE